MGIEPTTSSLPRMCSATELDGRVTCKLQKTTESKQHRVDVCRRAGDGARTRDIQLGRLKLYQLSYSRESVLRDVKKESVKAAIKQCVNFVEGSGFEPL